MSSVPQRLLAAASSLFAERGYEGASVRAICRAADTNMNAVTYHFGGKSGLYNAVILGVGERHLASARRILATPAGDRVELATRLAVFAEETLASWLEEPEILRILFVELQQGFRHCGPEALAPMSQLSTVLVSFLREAQGTGLVRPEVDVEIVAGALLERLNGQVLYVDAVQRIYGTSIKDEAYRRHWVHQTVDLLLRGAGTPEPPHGSA